MKRVGLVAMLALCGLLASVVVLAEETQDSADGEVASLGALLQAYHDVFGFSGSLRVSRSDEVVFEHAVGLAERSFEQPYTPSVRQPINSISKLVSALAALRLVQAGKLDLDQPIARYLPDLEAPWAGSVTTHHLLSHSSGLPREAGLEAHSELGFDEQLERVAELTLAFEPGSEYGYSNVGFILLGAVLEQASGQRYADMIRQQVLTPLGLEDTGVLEGRLVVARQAVPYVMTAAGVEQAQRTKTLGESAGGGLYSNGADLHAMMHVLRGDALLNAEMRQRLTRVHTPADSDVGEAYALSIQPFGPKKIWLAAGSGYGAKSVLIHVPEDEMVVSILSNWGNTPIMPMLRDVYLTLEGQPVELPDRSGLADPGAFSEHLGTYRFDPEALRQALQAETGLMRLHVSDGKLFLNDELMARGKNPDTLSLTYTNELIISLTETDMTLEIGGQVLTGKRLPSGG